MQIIMKDNQNRIFEQIEIGDFFVRSWTQNALFRKIESGADFNCINMETSKLTYMPSYTSVIKKYFKLVEL